jgi:putative phosphoribosyl transferase
MPVTAREPALQPLFSDRRHAGRLLAPLLTHLRSADPLVLALPRGGVPVGAIVAEGLCARLDVIVARKVALPSHSELALGAVTWDGILVVNEGVVAALAVRREELARRAADEGLEVARRTLLYRGRHPLPDVRGRTVVLVDDGVATGATVRAALRWLRSHAPRHLVLAVPVIAAEVAREFREELDELVTVYAPERLLAVGAWYVDFSPVPDEEVVRLLEEARARRG